ncbi:MAG: hypothetical protein ACM3PV_07560 [Betaproteobacteria bacterium]
MFACSKTVISATAALAAVLTLSCGGGGSPATPTTPMPTVAPTKPPTSGGGAAGCKLGNGDPGAVCGRGGSPQLLDRVEAAIDLLVQEKPQLFDLNDLAAPHSGLYRVLDQEGYLDGVVANLARQGACSERDGDDPYFERILVKVSNDYSEAYDVLTSTGYVRRGKGAMVDSCSPASFPIDRAVGDVPPAGSGCGRPYPPPVTRFNCKIHLPGIEFVTLDSTPIVGPDAAYCAAIGYTDGRSLCPVRPEGAPDRLACELWRIGRAKDTGRPGPTWTKSDGSYCTGKDSGCQNSPDNQFLLWAYVSGSYTVTAENGASCVVKVDR